MTDFFSPAWSIAVGSLTLLGLVACLALLFFAARRKVVVHADGSVDETTGHVWDGDLRELNNPLPVWWMVLFVVTVLFSFAYVGLYLGFDSAAEHAKDRNDARIAAEPLYTRFAAMTPQQLAADRQAIGVGERLFVNNCAACHGSDARGSKGFPDLTDDDWLWGGTPEQIKATIVAGRQGTMPPMAAAVGSPEEIRQLAHYVLSLSGGAHDNIAALLGRNKFGACAACHGAAGKGNPALGAPNLADKTWLHGWGEQAVVAMIKHGKTNVMPAHGERLSAEQIHVLSAYVWQLSQPVSKAP